MPPGLGPFYNHKRTQLENAFALLRARPEIIIKYYSKISLFPLRIFYHSLR
jgi:hypothetical protein